MACGKGLWPVVLAIAAGVCQVGAAHAASDYTTERAEMVERLRRNGIRSKHVLAAMQRVKRHLFASRDDQARAYEEIDIPVGKEQALYRPQVVARAIEMLDPRPGSRILQVGAGCGYCTAVLCEITSKVYVVDVRRDVLRVTERRLRALGYSSTVWRNAKGCSGWKQHAPFDAILVLCAADTVPKDLVQQLRDGGRLVIPVGRGPEQTLTCLRKSGGRLRSEVIMPIRVDVMACQKPLP